MSSDSNGTNAGGGGRELAVVNGGDGAGGELTVARGGNGGELMLTGFDLESALAVDDIGEARRKLRWLHDHVSRTARTRCAAACVCVCIYMYMYVFGRACMFLLDIYIYINISLLFCKQSVLPTCKDEDGVCPFSMEDCVHIMFTAFSGKGYKLRFLSAAKPGKLTIEMTCACTYAQASRTGHVLSFSTRKNHRFQAWQIFAQRFG